ncbi:MAG: tetratricopeptide repeat protein, partial [Phycisphaerae bacterium]
IASAAISLRRTRRTFAAIALTASAYAVVANVAIVIGALFAERYMHLTSAGLCLLFVHMVSRIAQSVAPSRGGVATAAVLSIAVVLYAGRSIVRHGDFATPQRLNAVDLSSHPRTARLWASRAADEIAARQWAQAAASASHAIEILDTDPRAWRLLGMARYQMRDADGALAAMQRSIALGGIGSENAATIAADVLKSRGDYAEAIAMLDRYFAAGGRSANLQNNLAWYLLTAVPESLRDPQRAITLAQRAFEMQPAEPDFADTYADALLAVGRGQDAKAAIQRTLGLLSTADARRRALQTKLAGIE